MKIKNKQSVLFLATWYPKKVKPSNGSFIRSYAEALSEFKNIYVLHVAEDPDQSEKYNLQTEERPGIVTVIVYYKSPLFKIPVISKARKYLLAQWTGYNQIKKISGGIDIIHLHVIFPAGLFALFLKYRYKIPYLITEHWTGYFPGHVHSIGILQKFFSKKIARKASVITVCTKDLQQQMESLSIKGNYEVVNNMTDLSLFDNSGMNNDNGKFRFLHISTLHDPQKNISGMLRAVKCLSQIRKDFEVVIAGKGNLEPYIRFAAELKIYETVVTFKGEQDQKEVGALMNAADCFFMFSNYENFPFTIVESFASGIPVIATNVGGIAEHLHAEHGMMVEPGNEKALCDAMENMIKFHSNYKKEELREYARKYFSREVVTKTFLKLYEETYVS